MCLDQILWRWLFWEMFLQLSQTNLSQNLWNKRKRIETGQNFLRLFGSRLGYFKCDVTKACLNWWATVPVEREWLTMFGTSGTRSARHCLATEAGIGSRQQILTGVCTMRSWTVFSENQDHCSLKRKVADKNESRSFQIFLTEKKPQKHSGRSECDNLAWRGLFLFLQRSLDTA